MKILLLTFILALISTNTMAEWTEVGESDVKGGYTAYANLASIRKASDRVKMWILFDYKVEQKASGVIFSSKEIRREYDCIGKHVRVLAFKLFSWNMARGELVRSYNQPQKWEEVQPDSMDETEMKVACRE
jgi:hypothetical protein